MTRSTSPPLLKYPLSLFQEDTDYMMIRVLTYEAPGLTRTGNNFGFRTSSDAVREALGSRENEVVQGRIILPIPSNLADFNATNWADSSINSIALDAIQQLKGGLNDLSVENLKDGSALSKISDRVKGILGQYKEAITDPTIAENLENFLVAGAVNIFGANVDANSLISRGSGQVLNPNLELIFKGVKLRNFQYAFDFNPRSQAEGEVVKGIIKTFKKRMAAKSTASSDGGAGIFIQAPEVFDIKFMRGSQPHPFLYAMKVCALTNMSTNYTGTGAYATYYDGTPVKMTMNLQFTELSPVYTEDYDNPSEAGPGVGF